MESKLIVTGHENDEPQRVDSMMALIERVVSSPDGNIDMLERMLQMRERMQAQASKAAFDNAIALAKAEIGPIIKSGLVDYRNKDGKQTNFTHETLDGIARAVDPILSKHGLSYRFRSDQDGGNVIVTCVVAHRDGYAEETTLRGAPDASGSKNPYQAVGSAVTYLQRYTLKLALGLSAAKDDDATTSHQSEKISADQLSALVKLIKTANADKVALLRFLQVDDLADLPAKKYGVADKMLRAKISQQGSAT